MKGDRERCLDVGMDDYLSKPLSQLDLTRVLEQWVKPKQQIAPEELAAPVPQLGSSSNGGRIDRRALEQIRQLDQVQDVGGGV